MTTGFAISNDKWAERVFPVRLKEVLVERMKRRGLDPDKKFVAKAHDLIGPATGVSKPTVSRWLSGSSLPKIEHILAVAEALDSDPAYLVGNTDADDASTSLVSLYATLPYADVMKVLRIMSEIRGADKLPDEQFASAGVKVMQMVERNPDMSDDEIFGAAWRMLKTSS